MTVIPVGAGPKGDKGDPGTGTIADGSVTTAKLADGAVTAGKLADDAVTTAKLVNENVTTAKLRPRAVTGSRIDGLAIATRHIQEGAVDAGTIADDAVTNVKMADDAVGLAELSATGTPSGSNFLRGDNTWATPDGSGGGRDIEGSNTIYVNPAGADEDPARPQLWAPTVVGGVWANDGSEEHTTARPIAKPLAIDEIASTDTRTIAHHYSYRFTESAGTQRVDETSRRVQSFPDAQGTGSVDTRPEWEWDGTANNFNQRNRAATVANWGSTTLTNRITVTVPLEGPWLG